MRRSATIIFSLVLLFAVSLKAKMLFTNPEPSGIAQARTWCELVIEWSLAIWLFSGVFATWAARAAMAVLAVFVVINLLHLLMDAADCGCFGNISVHPIWTLLLDLFLFSLFWLSRPRRRIVNNPSESYWSILTRLGSAAVISAAIPFALALPANSPRIVQIDPPKWVGKPLPLLQYIESPPARMDMKHGSRTVILFSHDCATCRDYLNTLPFSPNIRLIDVDTTGISKIVRPPISPVQLQKNLKYIGSVPWKLVLRNGVVKLAEREGENTH